jgi:hypothetical protein
MLPMVGTLLSSGLSLLANAVLVKGKDYVKEKTGVDLDKPMLSQQDLVSLKRYEAEHEDELLKLKLEDNELDLEELKTYTADTQNARKRETGIATNEKAPLLNRIAGPVIAFSTILLTFALFYIAIFTDFDPNQTGRKEVILYILGVLSAIATQIFSYYFRSSQGSAEKSRTIDNLLEARP